MRLRSVEVLEERAHVLDGSIVRAEELRLAGLSTLLALRVRELDAVLLPGPVLLVELDRRLRLALKILEERGDISRERRRQRHRAGGRCVGGLQRLAPTAARRRERRRRRHRSPASRTHQI